MYEPLRLATQPLTLFLLLLTVVTLASLRRSARRAWRWAAFGLTLSAVGVSHPYAAWAAARALEAQYPPAPAAARGVRSLVVLSGGLFAGANGEGVLAEDSLSRTVCAAELARRFDPEWIVVTGGGVNPATPASAAQRMRDLLVVIGIADARILVEPRATTTAENARESKALLTPRGIHRVGLVTDALHMPRSVGAFRAEGFDIVPMPCQAQAGPTFHWSVSTLVPGPRAAWLFNRAAHEWIALEYYRLSGTWR